MGRHDARPELTRLYSDRKIRGYNDYVVQWVNGGLSSEYWEYLVPADIAAELREKGATDARPEHGDR